MAGADAGLIQSLLTVTILLLGALLGGILCKRIGVAAVVGELLAGVLLAPTLLGGIAFLGLHLAALDERVKMLAEAGIILLIFLAGVETSFKRFMGSGLLATLVATGGVVVSFVLSYFFCIFWGLGSSETLLISAATTATSVSITYRTLKDLGVSQTDEGVILVSSAVIDDVLGLITMAIVLGIIGGSSTGIAGIGITAAKAIGFWIAMLLVGVFLLAKLFDILAPAVKKYTYSLLLSFTACFAFAWAAGFVGLSPIVGSFVAGMSMAETRLKDAATEVAREMSAPLAVLFFAYTGAQASLSGVTVRSLIFAALLILVCVVGKVLGCGLPVLAIRRNLREALIVGIGMIPRVEVGLIIATMGLTMGILSKENYSALIMMAIVTTVITPLALKVLCSRKHGREEPGEQSARQMPDDNRA